MNTFGDMQNEMDFFGRCNEFENIHDYVKFLWKSDEALLVYEVLLFRVNIFRI